MVRYYSQKPLYVWTRRVLLAILAITTVLLICIAIISISKSAPCLEYWQKSPVYQIYPRSFKDSDGDGIGDLPGIIEKLDYISETLGISNVWLNPIYDSPQEDMGYDISDFKKIWPAFGTMDDFE